MRPSAAARRALQPWLSEPTSVQVCAQCVRLQAYKCVYTGAQSACAQARSPAGVPIQVCSPTGVLARLQVCPSEPCALGHTTGSLAYRCASVTIRSPARTQSRARTRLRTHARHTRSLARTHARKPARLPVMCVCARCVCARKHAHDRDCA